MRNRLLINNGSSLALLLLNVAAIATTAVQASTPPKDRIFARYKGPRGRRLIRKCASNILRDNDDDDIVIIETNNPQCIRQLQRDSDNVIEADIDHPVEGLATPGLRGFLGAGYRALDEEVPYGMELIQADELEAGDNEVTICVVDTGVAIGHPEFDQANINGTDIRKFYGPEWKWDADNDGHGTHVAGIMAAKAGNERGVRGVSSKLKLHVVRALDDNGRGYESDIRAAVEECVAVNANIINLSLGGTSMSRRSSQFYNTFVNEYGIMMVAAAGNDGNTRAIYPAAHPAVISVSAVTDSGARWGLSNHGNQIELSAPGARVLSTMVSTSSVELENGYAYPAATISGTVKERVTGELVECDADEDKCKDAKNGGICLFERQNNDQVHKLLDACIEGGGAAAIIYNSNGGSADDLRVNPDRAIVAVGIAKGFALELIGDGFLGEDVTVGDDAGDGREYSYGVLSGTSMASPHVAAAAGLLMTHFPNCSNHQIRYALAVTAHHPNGGDDHCDTLMGYGVIKVKDAYDWLEEDDCTTWDVTEKSQGGCTTLHLGIEDVEPVGGGMQGV